MTELLEHSQTTSSEPETIEKVTILISKGSLEGIYPGLLTPTLLGALPGFSALATRMMKRQMEKIDIPPIPEFIELVADSGAHLYACKATVDMFDLTMDDFA